MDQRRKQQLFIFLLQRLAAKLYRHERSSTLTVLLKELRNAVQARREGVAYNEAEGFAWHRAEWRVRLGRCSIRHGRKRPWGFSKQSFGSA